MPFGGSFPQHRSPAIGEALETLHRLDRRRDDSAGRQQHRRWTRDGQCRSGLQGRNRVRSQAVASATFCPIESDRTGRVDLGPFPVGRIVGKKDTSGIARLARHDEHSSTALRQAECPAVHDAVRPSVTALFESIEDGRNGRSSRQMQHEIYVFDDDPRHGAAVEQFEQSVDNRALPAIDSSLVAGHGKVLTWKASRNDIGILWQILERCHIRGQPNFRPSMTEYTRCVFVVLADKNRAVTGPFESQLESADTSEQARYQHDANRRQCREKDL